MKNIKRIYSAKACIDKATGFIGRAYIGWNADATIEVTGEESVFTSLNGTVSVSGKVDQFYDKKGKKVSIGSYKTSFENETAEISEGVVNIAQDGKHIIVNVEIKMGVDGKTLSASMTGVSKGYWTFLANNVVMSGSGEQKGEDVEIEGPILPPEDPEILDNPQSGPVEAAKKLTGNESGFLWKPVGENSKKLVVLLPSAFTDLTKKKLTVNTETSSLATVANGGREHYRYGKPGSGYPSGTTCEIETIDGRKWQWNIASPSKRTENIKAKVISTSPGTPETPPSTPGTTNPVTGINKPNSISEMFTAKIKSYDNTYRITWPSFFSNKLGVGQGSWCSANGNMADYRGQDGDNFSNRPKYSMSLSIPLKDVV